MLALPPAEELDDVRDEVDVTALAVLGRAQLAAGVGAAYAHDSFVEIDVPPAESRDFARPHAGLESKKADGLVDALVQFREEARQLCVLEVGGLLALRTGLLSRMQFAHRIEAGVAIANSGAEARAQHAQVLRARGRGTAVDLARCR